jgi:hypothetical protein
MRLVTGAAQTAQSVRARAMALPQELQTVAWRQAVP